MRSSTSWNAAANVSETCDFHWWPPPRFLEGDVLHLEAVCQVVDVLFPEMPLNQEQIADFDDVHPVADRVRWWTEAFQDPRGYVHGMVHVTEGAWLKMNASASYSRHRFGWDARPLHVCFSVGERALAGMERSVLIRVGDALGALRGEYDPPELFSRLYGRWVLNFFPEPSPPYTTPFDLPPLYQRRDMPDAMLPLTLSWLNYWSAELAARFGFPDPARDAEWLALSQRSETTGAWLVALTEDPLDLDRPEHVAALQRAWARFDLIGPRVPPPRIQAKLDALKANQS